MSSGRDDPCTEPAGSTVDEQPARPHPERESVPHDPSSPGATLLRDDLEQAEPNEPA
jgi:hypothetical protein